MKYEGVVDTRVSVLDDEKRGSVASASLLGLPQKYPTTLDKLER